MSKSNLKSSVFILKLMPYIVEDYCRLQNFGLEVNEVSKHRFPKKQKSINSYKPVDKHKIHIEIVPDTAKKSQNSTKLIPLPGKLKKSAVAVGEKNLRKSLSWDSTGEPKPADILTKQLSNFGKRKKFSNDYLSIMKRKSEETQKESLFKRLSIPKSIQSKPTKSPWTLTKAIRNFKPSERLLKLAEFPMSKALHKPNLSEILHVKPAALAYKATLRIQELAYPKATFSNTDQQDPFKVSPKALRAKLSSHVRHLASPKQRIDYNQRKHPFKVKRRALNAKPSSQIKKLAVPKVRNSS